MGEALLCPPPHPPPPFFLDPNRPVFTTSCAQRHEAHTVLPMLLKHVPRKFVEEAIRFLFFRLLRRNKDMHGVSQALDKTLIVTVLYEFEKLASSYQNLNTEFKGAYDGIVANAEANAKLDVLRVRSLHGVSVCVSVCVCVCVCVCELLV